MAKGRKRIEITKEFCKKFNLVRESCCGVRLSRKDLIDIFKVKMNYNIEYNFPYFVKFGIFKKFGNPSWGFTYEVTSKPVYIGVLETMQDNIYKDKHLSNIKYKKTSKYSVQEDGTLKTNTSELTSDFVTRCVEFISKLSEFELNLMGLTKIKK